MQQVIKSASGQNWEWIDILNPTKEELNEVARQYGLHPSSVVDSLQPEHLPKYEVINEIVFIINRVYDPHTPNEADTIRELTTKIAIFYSEKFLITIHRQPLDLLKEVQQAITVPGGIKSTFDLLLKVVRESLKSYEPPAQVLAADLDRYEAMIFLQRNIPPLTKGLYHLKRQAAVSKKVLQLSEPLLTSLRLNYETSPNLQDLLDYYVRISTIYDEINDSMNNLLNMYISLSSQRTNEVMRILTIFSVFFMPLTFIAGIYGMNFEFMPELQVKYGYPLTMVAMAAVSAGIYYWFRKKGWM